MSVDDTEVALPQSRSLAIRFCGRWIISWKLLIINILISGFIIVGGDLSRADENTSIRLWLFYLLLAYASVVLFSTIIHRTLFKNRATQPVPLWMVLAFQFVFGSIFATVYQLGIVASRVPVQLSAPSRIILIISTSIWLGLSSSALADIWEEISRRHNELVARRVHLLILELNQKNIETQLRNELQIELEMGLQESNTELIQNLQRITKGMYLKPSKISQAIKNSAEQSIRPLSKALWRASANSYPRPRFGQIALSAMREQPIQTFWLTSLIVLSQSINPFIEIGFWRGLLMLTITVISVTAICETSNFILKRAPRFGIQIFVTAFIFLQIRRRVTEMQLERWGQTPLNASTFRTQLIINALSFIFLSILSAWYVINEQSLNKFQDEINEDQIAAITRSKQTSDIARDLSRILHGAVQTRLVACAMLIDNSSKTGDEVSLNLALLEALSILQAPLPKPEVGLDLSSEVARKISLWEGLCSFELQIDPRLENLQNPEPREVGRLIEEGISNAIRHGKASTILISIMSGASGSVVIQIDDNGSGISKSNIGKPGIGNAIFSLATGGSWSLTSLDRGTRLLAVLSTNKTKD